jgi:uncharacterized protein (DUF58 family)
MTTRGRTLAALAASMLLFGRLGGMRELIMSGAAFALVLAVGFLLVWVRRGHIAVRREVHPTRTIVGNDARVELIVEARGRFGLGPVLLSDRVPRGLAPSPRLALPGGTRKRARAVSYPLTPRMRGRYAIGPLEITHTDPFGAVRRRRRVAGTSPLLVYPSYEEIGDLPSGVQRIGIVRHSPLVGHGDEFFALRAYEEGDDLRKIHWPTSAKVGQLVVRQEELLAEPRALIVLDTCATKHRGSGPGASIEAAVSACAAIGVLALRRRMRVDVVTPEGPLLTQRRTTSEHQLLEALALLAMSKRRSVAGALDRAERPRAGRPALVVVISPGLAKDELRAIALRVRGAVAGVVVRIDAPTYEGAVPASGRRRTAAVTASGLALPMVTLRAGDSFRRVWHSVIKDVALAR